MRTLKAYMFHSKKGVVEQLEGVLKEIRSEHLSVLDPSNLMECLLSPDFPQGQYVLFTFDDGREQSNPGVVDFLEKNNIRALAFVFPLLYSMDGYRMDLNFWYRNRHLFEFGSHSLTHSNVAQLAGPKFWTDMRALFYRNKRTGKDFAPGLITKGWDQLRERKETLNEKLMRIDSEVYLSKAIIERSLGVPCNYFSYPWGVYDKNLIDSVKRAGYHAAFSVINTDASIWTIPRTDMDSLNAPVETISFQIGKCAILRDC